MRKKDSIDLSIFDGADNAGGGTGMVGDGVDLTIFDNKDEPRSDGSSGRDDVDLSIFYSSGGATSSGVDSASTRSSDDGVRLSVISWELLVEEFRKAKEIDPLIEDCVAVLSVRDGKVSVRLGFGRDGKQVANPSGVVVDYEGCRFDDRLSLLLNQQKKMIVEL